MAKPAPARGPRLAPNSVAKKSLKPPGPRPAPKRSPTSSTSTRPPSQLGGGGELSAGLPVRPELIVAFTLLRIGEDVIGLPDILKFLFRGCVVTVDVGMILTRQLAIGFFYVARSRGARHTEDFVVILELDSHG